MAVEGKFDPTTELEQLRLSDSVQKFKKKLLQRVKDDDQSRTDWLVRQGFFVRRRYGMEFRDVDFPWPGASSIVVPTIDTAIDQLKPTVIRSTLGTNPPVTVLGQNQDAEQNAPNIELLLEHLINSRMPRFAEEIAHGADHYHQHGFCVFKVDYQYRTRRNKEIVTRDRLPSGIEALLPFPDISAEQADQLTDLTGVSVFSRDDFKQAEVREGIGEQLRDTFGLDPDDEDDRESERTLIDFVANPNMESVEITRRVVVEDTPALTAVPPEDIIVADYVRDVQNAKRITHRMFLTEEEIIEKSRDAGWAKAATEKLLDPATKNKAARADRALRQARDFVSRGFQTGFVGSFRELAEDLREIWEVYTWFDVDGDGFPEKVVVTLDPSNENILRIIELPFNHGKWPFVQIRFEYTGDKKFYNTRGVPEILDDLDCEITTQHRAKLDRMAIANAPVFLYRMGQHINPGNLRFIPGQMYPVTRLDDIGPLPVPNVDISFEREEQVLTRMVERRTGNLQASAGEESRLTRPRTATEVQALGSVEAEIQGSRMLLWHSGMAKVYDMVWDLWVQYGPDEVSFRVMNTDRPVRLTKHELQGNFVFRPTPAALQPPQLRLQKSQAVLSQLIQVMTATGGNLGDEFEFNPGEALHATIEATDIRLARRVARRRSPQEIQQIRQQRQAAQEARLNPEVSGQGDVNQVADRVSKAAAAADRGEIAAEGTIGP